MRDRYLDQVREGEIVDVATSVYADGARIYFYHVMERDGQLMVDDLVEAALVSAHGRPTRISTELIRESGVIKKSESGKNYDFCKYETSR